MKEFIATNSGWGSETTMTDVEAVFWRAEVDPRLRSGGVIVDVLEHPPEWDRLVAAHEWATRLVPRLSQRVVDDPLRLGPPEWVATEVDLAHHLSRMALEPGQGFDHVLEIAASLHMAAFDPRRPLWQAVMVEGLEDGTCAYLLKVHHSMTDGQGIVQLFDLLHGRSADPTPDKAMPPPLTATVTGPLDLAAQRAYSMVRGSPRSVAHLASGLGRSVARGLTHHDDIFSIVSYAASLARVAGSPPGTPSPLLRTRGLSRRLLTVDVGLTDLRASGKAAGGTLNDAFLAGLLGGLRRYHGLHGMDVGDLPIALPVSLRRDTDAPGGNRFAAASIAGPAGEPDPRARIEQIHERVRRVRQEPALDFMASLAPVASRLPGPVLAKVALRLSQAIDLQASNIPGLDRPAYIAGARILRMYVFGPVPGCAIMATLISHGGTCCIGVTIDHAAVPDPDLLRVALEDGFSEVARLVGSA